MWCCFHHIYDGSTRKHREEIVLHTFTFSVGHTKVYLHICWLQRYYGSVCVCIRPLFVGSQFLIPRPHEKCIFQNFAIMPLFTSAHAQNVTSPSLGRGLGTTLGQDICKCGTYCWAAWYIVVLFAKWCFYSEFPVKCYNGIMVMTALLKGNP